MTHGIEPASLKVDDQPDDTVTQAAAPPALRVLISLPALVAECLVVVFAVVIIVGRNYPPDARLFPTIVASLGLLLCAIFLAACLASPAYVRRAAADMEEALGDVRGFWISCVTPPIYCVGIYLLGFHVASFIAMLVMPWLLGYRDRWRLVAVAAAVVIVLHLVFVVAVEVELPNGLLGDFLLRRFVYED